VDCITQIDQLKLSKMKIKDVDRFLKEEESYQSKKFIKSKPKKMKAEEFQKNGKKPMEKKSWKV
jgi:hypothetical protein